MAGILFIRHQETVQNISGNIIQGQSIDGRLTLQGEANAQYTCGRVYDNYGDSIKSIFSSPLERAVRSIKPLSEKTGLPIVPTPLLAERSFGEYEGQRACCLGILEEEILTTDFCGVESINDVLDRVYTFINNIKGGFSGKDNLVVASTHQLIIQYAMNIGGKGLTSKIAKTELKTYNVPNGYSYLMPL